MVILTFMAIEPLVVGHSIEKIFSLVSYFEPLADVHIGEGIRKLVKFWLKMNNLMHK